MTVFDPSTLHRLVDGSDGRAFALELVSTFRRMLDQRVTRLQDAVLASDPDEAMDAALSLKVSSTMTGASELAELAAFIEADLRAGDLPSARALSRTLLDASDRAGRAIDDYLLRSRITA